LTANKYSNIKLQSKADANAENEKEEVNKEINI